nr:hypothetical protein [Tanacetum cinerariifolium]
RKNELKARGTLLMALPDKHQLKFNSHKDTKTLMQAIKKRFGGNTENKKVQKTILKQQYENFIDINLKFLRSLPSEWRTHTLIWRNKTDLEEQSLDDLFNSLKIYEAEVKSSSSACTTTQNIAFMSSSNTDSTTESVSAAARVSVINAKMPVSFLPNVDSLRRNLRANGPTSLGFDMSKLECYNCHMKGHFVKECRSPKDSRMNGAAEPQRRNVPVETSTSNALVSKCDGVRSYDWSFQAEEDPATYALMTFSSSSSFSDNELRDNALVNLRQTLEKAEQERDDLKLKLEKFQTSFKNLTELLASQTNAKIESDESWPSSSLYDRFQSSDGYHAVPLPYIGTFMPPKPNLVFNNVPNGVRTDHYLFNVKLSPTKPDQDLSHTYRPSTPIIEDWVSDFEDESKTKPPQNVSSFVQPTEQVKSPRHSVSHVETSIPAATPKPASPKHTSNGKKGIEKHALHVVLAVVLTPSKPVPITAVRPVNTTVPKTSVTRPKQVKPIVTKPKSPIKRHINRSPSPKASNSPPKVTAVTVPVVNAAQGSQGKWEWKPKCLILDHVFCNTSASITLKRFDYNDAFGRSKSVMTWVPKRI